MAAFAAMTEKKGVAGDRCPFLFAKSDGHLAGRGGRAKQP
jgi:hypothetical protein